MTDTERKFFHEAKRDILTVMMYDPLLRLSRIIDQCPEDTWDNIPKGLHEDFIALLKTLKKVVPDPWANIGDGIDVSDEHV